MHNAPNANKCDVNNVMEMYFQLEDNTLRIRAVHRLLANILEEPFFQVSLRRTAPSAAFLAPCSCLFWVWTSASLVCHRLTLLSFSLWEWCACHASFLLFCFVCGGGV